VSGVGLPDRREYWRAYRARTLERQRTQDRERYRTDPAYRERLRRNRKRQYERRMSTPEGRAMLAERARGQRLASRTRALERAVLDAFPPSAS
jgi:hypothetical protein